MLIVGSAFPSLFPGFYLVLVLDEEVDVVQAVHQAVFLVGVDFEMLAPACGLVRDGLAGEVNFDFCLRVSLDAGEELLEERLAHDYGKDEVVQLIVLVDVCEEARHDHPEAVVSDGPGGMFPA